MSDTSYAALTRAKSKFGKRLTEKDYKSLLDCANVAEVMTYLKSNTRYYKAFGEANERGIRRGLFENLLRQYLNEEIDVLSRYELTVGEDFSKYIAHKTEVNEIIRFMTLLNSTETRGEKPFNFTFPQHIAKKTSIRLSVLADAKNYSDILKAVKGTEYEAILKKYKISDDGYIPVTEIENELYIGLYRDLYSLIDSADSTESSELKDIVDTLIDYENFIRIFRLKKYYNADQKSAEKLLLPFGSIPPKKLNEMIKAQSSKEVFEIMSGTKPGKMLGKIKYHNAGEIPLRVKYKKARHNMYFSDSPSTVLLSYEMLCEIELHNLIVLIEAARYNVSSDKIEPLLIY